jgi:hypothetical protein
MSAPSSGDSGADSPVANNPRVATMDRDAVGWESSDISRDDPT